MKTKCRILILILALTTLMSSAAFAAVKADVTTVSPKYLVTEKIVTSFVIDKDGLSNSIISVQPKSSSTVDNVKATVSIIKDSTGLPVKTWKNVPLDPNGYGRYYFDESYKIPTKGSYHLEATIKLYDGTTLKETVKCDSFSDSF